MVAQTHRCYFKIADITIKVDSDLAINKNTFADKFKHFKVTGPGNDNISIKHHFFLPDINIKNFGKEVYRKIPWIVYKNINSWIYLAVFSFKKAALLNQVIFINNNYTKVEIFNKDDYFLRKSSLPALTMFTTDQIFLAHILADREGCYLHSCGVNLDGKGLLFAGNSGAGKSTIAKMLKNKAKLLCDDRIILRRKSKGFKMYGTWDHGEVAQVSGSSIRLKGIMFLEKAKENKIILIEDKKDKVKRILACLIRPLVTVAWWQKSLALVETIAEKVPCYILKFDKSGEIVKILEQI